MIILSGQESITAGFVLTAFFVCDGLVRVDVQASGAVGFHFLSCADRRDSRACLHATFVRRRSPGVHTRPTGAHGRTWPVYAFDV